MKMKKNIEFIVITFTRVQQYSNANIRKCAINICRRLDRFPMSVADSTTTLSYFICIYSNLIKINTVLYISVHKRIKEFT